MSRNYKSMLFAACSLLLVTSLQAQQKQIQYLSGTDAANTVQWDFFCTAGRNSGEWKKIGVPSNTIRRESLVPVNE